MTDQEISPEELKKFWEWCGKDVTHEYIQTTGVIFTVCKKCGKTLEYNKKYKPLCKAPALTLDSLFKIAVPKLPEQYELSIQDDKEMLGKSVCLHNFSDWSKLLVALFRAIQEAIKMTEKLSECCGKEDPEFGICFLLKGHTDSHQYSPCTIASEPDDPSRLQEAAPGAIERIIEAVSKPESRSVQRRIAAQKGLPAPDFSKLDASQRLLTDEEINTTETPCETCKIGEKEISQSEADEACNMCFYKLVAKAQDAKTYTLTELEGEEK